MEVAQMVKTHADQVNISSAHKLLSCINFTNVFVFKTPLAKRVLPIIQVMSIVLLVLYAVNTWHTTNQLKEQTKAFLSSPKVNDLYFLDFRLLSDKLRPHEKYRLAKVVDVTGDVVTLLYGSFFYLRQQAVEKSIKFGQLRYKDYFETKRYNFTLAQLKSMEVSSAIYMVKRPVLNKLFGNFINPATLPVSNKIYIPGKKQNNAGVAFLNIPNGETNLDSAFSQFRQSAELGFAPGQVNLGEMYVNGNAVQKDLKKALYWFEQAALQSHKPGVLKYAIVCQQVSSCSIVDFYERLISAGVNIKIRQLDFSLTNES